MLLLVLLGTAAFAGLGLLMAGTLRAEATLAAANLVYLLLLVGGGIGTAGPLPARGAAVPGGDARRRAGRGTARRAAPRRRAAVGSVGVLAAWAVVGGSLAARTFRWE